MKKEQIVNFLKPTKGKLLLMLLIGIFLAFLIQLTSTPNCPSEIPTIFSWSCPHNYNVKILLFAAPLNILFGLTSYSTFGTGRIVAFILSTVINLPYYFLLSCLVFTVYNFLNKVSKKSTKEVAE